ncbi:MAG: hypothetical protein JKY19_09330 [Alcanivoracaceae bacterium]|nr:hypothetical protein [Alcanivoracaceae bacterium]
MKFIQPFYILIISLLLLSCAGAPRKKPDTTEVFVTNITDAGVKQFSLSISIQKPKGHYGGRKSSGGKGRRGGGKGMRGGDRGSTSNREEMQQKAQERIWDRLKFNLTKSGYCQQGYIETDSYFSMTESIIKGECKEKASEKDKVKFVNSQGN